MMNGTAAQEVAVEKAISDFLKCKLSKKHNAFSVSIYERGEYDPYEIGDDLITVSILGTITEIPYYRITLVDTLGSTRLPTRHVIKDGKLFYWYDSDYGLTEETIKVFLEYDLAELMDISDLCLLLGQEGYLDGGVKSADYYFCKQDLSNYKRVITSIATGWYKPPKVKCK